MSIYASVLTGGSNNHQTTSEEANYMATDFVSEGVVGAITNTSGVSPSTGGFAVNAQGTPDMTVAVSTGVAYVQATPTGGTSQTLRVYNNASSNVTISSNSSGSTKYDWVYIKVDPDTAANPNTAGSDVVTLVTSRSSSASTDDGTPPAYGYPLAVVTVANAAPSITNGNIADVRQQTGPVPLQAVQPPAYTNSTALATGTTIIPLDDTIPQNTEGDQYMTCTITPKSALNTLKIEAIIICSSTSTATNLIAALFQDSTANALAATTQVMISDGNSNQLVLRHTMTAGTTAATTFKVRAGRSGAGTFTFNGRAGGRLFGAITKSSIVVTEYKA